MITETNRLENWEIDDNGFLRTRARILKSGVMMYAGSEIGRDDKKAHPIYVPPEEVFNAEAMYSLEGMPVTVDHQWIDPDSPERGQAEVGSVAGQPRQNGAYLEADLVIRDQAAIDAVKAGKLVDISSAYLANTDELDGHYQNELYSGQQHKIRFNHVALLPPGKGRGGREVRVLNSDGDTPAQPEKGFSQPAQEQTDMEFATVNISDSRQVRVHNADAGVLTSDLEAMRVENKGLSDKLAAASTDLAKVKNDLEAMTGERDQAIEAKEKAEGERDEALDPNKLQAAAEQMAADQADAVEVLVANGADKVKAAESIKGLAGHDLRVATLNCVRVENSRPELTEEQAASTGYVQGAFDIAVENAKSDRENHKIVNGAGPIQNAMKAKPNLNMGMMKHKNMPLNMQNMSKEEMENADPFGYKAMKNEKKEMMENMDHEKKGMMQ